MNDQPLEADGLGDAIIGTHKDGRIIYSIEQCVDILVERDGLTPEESREFLEFNTFCAYVGPMTPIFVYLYGE